MDTAVVVIFVALSIIVILTGIKWIYSIASLLIRLTWKIIKGIGTVLLFPIGLIMKVLKI